jgi:hypothetical protein
MGFMLAPQGASRKAGDAHRGAGVAIGNRGVRERACGAGALHSGLPW